MDNLKSLAAQMRKAIHSSKPNTHFTMMIRIMDQIDTEIKNLESLPTKEVVEDIVEDIEETPTKNKKGRKKKTSTED